MMRFLIFSLFSTGFVILLMLTGGCASQRSIEDHLNDVQRRSYRQWQQQHSEKSPADTAAASLSVKGNNQSHRQPVITGKLTLQDAVKLGLRYNRDLQSAIEKKELADGRLLESYSQFTPTISVDASYRRPEKVNSFKINGREVQIGFLNNYSVQLSVTQPIFDYGDYAAGLKGARLYKTLTDKNIQAVATNTIFLTNQMYLQVLLDRQQYLVNKQQVALSDSMLQDVKTKKHFGTASDFNVLRAKVQYSNDRTAMLRARNSLEQDKAQLYKTLGVSQNSNVELKDTLQYHPYPVNESQAVKKALVNRPDLDAQLLNLKLQHKALQRARGKYFPSVSAFFRNQWAKPNPFISTENSFGRIYNAGLQLNWSLFDLSREGQIKQEKSTLRQQKINYLDQRDQVFYEVHSAILGMENARKSIQTQKLTLQQAKEGLRLAKVGYRQGTEDQTSVLNARQSFAEAQLNYFRSLRNYEQAHLQLLKATGRLRFKVNEPPANVNAVKFDPKN